ncbi:ATP-binding protein [Dysgonomonas termitidis]|uniref:ATP-binding protein n=1 Tax=Dysgonomonas termitidis TaxID=1516126 RepID=A0ABV9L3M0_9BACT
MTLIGKVVATEKNPTTIDDFYFWTDKKCQLKPFDVVVVKHIENTITYGVIEEISHITDAPSYLAGFISNDFGDVQHEPLTERIGMNYVKCRVVGNTNNIYTPVLDGSPVLLADEIQIKEALGLSDVKNPLPAGYIEMYEGENKKTIPVHFNSHFLIGPEGAHLNISGISGLAAKTSYAMFLMKSIQDTVLNSGKDESVAFVLLNVKGHDLLSIDELNTDKKEVEEIAPIYKLLGLEKKPFDNVKYFYPYSKEIAPTTYAAVVDVENQIKRGCAFQYKYVFEDDRDSIDLLFANVDDPNETMESIVNYISTGQGKFNGITSWEDLKRTLYEHTQTGNKDSSGKEITVLSWRKFYRLFNKSYEKNKSLFANRCCDQHEVRLKEQIQEIKKNDVFVIDIAKLDEETQGFVFGDVMRAIYDLKLGATDKKEAEIPSKIVIFIDELNKYASSEIPKNSPILKQLLDITERGRSLGIILFGAEQFISDIHKRVKGNCATLAYGRTNVIEISKGDFQFVPSVYKSMLTRLKQGEYILQNPIFRSLLNIKFPKPIHKYK